MKLTPAPIDAERFSQVHRDFAKVYGYVARREQQYDYERPNIIHLEFSDISTNVHLESIFKELRQVLTGWGERDDKF